MSQREKYPKRNAEIRRLYAAGGVTFRGLAERYRVSISTIRGVIDPGAACARAKKRHGRLYGYDDEYTEKHRANNRQQYQKRKMEARP